MIPEWFLFSSLIELTCMSDQWSAVDNNRTVELEQPISGACPDYGVYLQVQSISRTLHSRGLETRKPCERIHKY